MKITRTTATRIANTLVDQYGARPASLPDGDDYWVCARARLVDLSSEADVRLVRDLDVLMSEFMKKYRWAAASSNNILWNATYTPIRVIKVPNPRRTRKITLVNPEIELYGDAPFNSYEQCGALTIYEDVPKPVSIPFFVPRAPSLEIRGYRLRKNGFSYEALQYERTDTRDFDEKGRSISHPVAFVQHEYDHLDGVLLSDRSNFYEWLLSKPDDLFEKAATWRDLVTSIEIEPHTFSGKTENLDGWVYRFPVVESVRLTQLLESEK